MQTLDIQVLELVREMLVLTVLIAGPLLLVGMVVSLLVAIFQALTSVQEQTLAVVPKMFAVALVGLFLLAPTLGLLRDFCLRVLERLNSFGTT